MALVKFDESALESEVDLVKKKRTSGPGIKSARCEGIVDISGFLSGHK